MDLSQFESGWNLNTDQKSFFSKVFLWMGLAMLVSWWVARYVSLFPQLVDMILWNDLYFWGIMIIEFGLVFYLTAKINTLSVNAAGLMFILFSIINGAFLSVIFLIFELNSIISLFGATAILFIIMGRYGYTTNRDLTKLGSLAFMGLIGIIIGGVINIWLKNAILDLIVTSLGVIIFVGLIAYDIQKLKKMNTPWDEGTENEQKEAIIGALALYLDFINLFLKLLRLFWKRK